MDQLRWRRYQIAVALLVIYAFGFVFADLLFSRRTAFWLGAIALFVALGLWLRFRGSPAEAHESPAPPTA